MIYRNVAPQIRMPKNRVRACLNCGMSFRTDAATYLCKTCHAAQRQVQSDPASTPSRRMSRKTLHLVLALFLLSTPALRAAVTPPHIPAVIQIESSNNPAAYNASSGARGLMQVTPVVLDEWNAAHPTRTYALHHLFTPEINRVVGTWYLTKRLPVLIRSKHPTDLLIGFNYGPAAFHHWRIKHRARYSKLPSETRHYLQRYDRLTRAAAKTRITKKPRYTSLTKKGKRRHVRPS